MAIIDITGLQFSYGSNQVLKGINLQVEAGELVALLGSNGVGKTTLIENLLGLRTPAAGKVTVGGHNPAKAGNSFWGQIGLVQQHWADHKAWRVGEQLQWVSAHYQALGLATITVREALESVGLAERETAKLGQLSGGQRRRVDLATAILEHPRLLVLDEPTTGLDPVSKAQVHDLISAVQDESATIFFATHDLFEAEKLASRIIIMNHGVIIADDTPARLRDQLAGKAEVTWFEGGEKFVHATHEVEAFVARLDLGRITGLTITRPTLEDAYLKLIGAQP